MGTVVEGWGPLQSWKHALHCFDPLTVSWRIASCYMRHSCYRFRPETDITKWLVLHSHDMSHLGKYISLSFFYKKKCEKMFKSEIALHFWVKCMNFLDYNFNCYITCLTLIVMTQKVTLDRQWLEHCLLVYHGCFEVILQSLGKIP